MINIGEYIEMAVEWLTEHGASFFDLLSLGVESVIDGILCVLLGIPFYITIAILTFLALYKSGRGTGIFTLLGLSLVYGMGFWEETMQTLALVLSSTGMALMLGIPLGIWMVGSGHCNKILQPVLDCMQTMPAFVYLIPAVLFFGLGTVPGAFATIIFALPPVARLTALGLRQVPKNVEEAARPAPVQGGAAIGIAHHSRRCQPDHHDVALHGGGSRHDLSWRSGGSGIERYHPDEDRHGIRGGDCRRDTGDRA